MPKNGIISVFITIFTSLTMHGYGNWISFGDPENCIDPFPYGAFEPRRVEATAAC